MEVKGIGISNICSAFEDSPIGSKVTDPMFFLECLKKAIAAFDWESAPTKGQAVLDVPAALSYVSGGVGRPTSNADDYCVRSHRGRVGAYLKRSHALPVKTCRVVVYTVEAYYEDPQVEPDEVLQMFRWVDSPSPEDLFVIVAVLASGDEPSLRSPYRFVDCLAGGNNEADTWTLEDIRRMAKEIIDAPRLDVVAG